MHVLQLKRCLNVVRHEPSMELEASTLDDLVSSCINFLQCSGHMNNDENAQHQIKVIHEVLVLHYA